MTMKFYQELTLIPSDDIPPYAVWSKVYNQLHIALAELANTHGITSIGVAFPNYRYSEKFDNGTLGARLRVFAPTFEALENLDLARWLDRLTDYIHLKSIAEVGDKATAHVVVERYRFADPKKQAERFAQLKNISFEQALEHCLTHKKQPKNYPFIELFSQTNQIPYRLYVRQTKVDRAVVGAFSVYGMHNQGGQVAEKATVPHW